MILYDTVMISIDIMIMGMTPKNENIYSMIVSIFFGGGCQYYVYIYILYTYIYIHTLLGTITYPIPAGTCESMIFPTSHGGICDRFLEGTSFSRWKSDKIFKTDDLEKGCVFMSFKYANFGYQRKQKIAVWIDELFIKAAIFFPSKP